MPNQPKTPISGFRLDAETKDRIRRQAEAGGVTMTEAIRRASEAIEEMRRAMEKGMPDEAAHAYAVKSLERREHSEAAVNVLAETLMDRDWPNDLPRQRGGKRYEYACRAAAILNGEAWAIRKTWPEAAHEIATRSDWN